MKCDTWCKTLRSRGAFMEAESVSLLEHHTRMLCFCLLQTSDFMVNLGFEEL